MEKVIQGHLRRDISQFSLIVNSIILKGYGREYFKDKIIYTFHMRKSGSIKCSYEIIGNGERKETIYSNEEVYNEPLIEFEMKDTEITLKRKNSILSWLVDGTLYCEIISSYNDERVIYYLSNKITHIKNGDVLVIYDLKEYLKSCKLPFKNDYTSDDLDRILKGDLDLARKKGDVITYIGEDGKIVMISCFYDLFYRSSKKIIYEYLKNKRNIKELIAEMETLRENPRSYKSQIINSLSKYIHLSAHLGGEI